MRGYINVICFSFFLILFSSSAISNTGLNDKLFEKNVYVQENYNAMDSETFMLFLAPWALTRGVIINCELYPDDIEKRKYVIGDLTGEEAIRYFCKNNGYTYTKSEKIVNIVPKSMVKNRNYVMNMTIQQLKANNEDRFQIFDKIVDELKRLYPDKIILNPDMNYESETKITTSEVRTKDQEIIGKIKKPLMKFVIRNATVRDALNKISEKEDAFWLGYFRDNTDNMLIINFSLESYYQLINRAKEKMNKYKKHKQKECERDNDKNNNEKD